MTVDPILEFIDGPLNRSAPAPDRAILDQLDAALRTLETAKGFDLDDHDQLGLVLFGIMCVYEVQSIRNPIEMIPRGNPAALGLAFADAFGFVTRVLAERYKTQAADRAHLMGEIADAFDVPPEILGLDIPEALAVRPPRGDPGPPIGDDPDDPEIATRNLLEAAYGSMTHWLRRGAPADIEVLWEQIGEVLWPDEPEAPHG